MRREELAELAKVHGIDLAVELTDAELEVVVGGLDKSNSGGGPGRSNSGFFGSKVFGGNSSSRRF
ncbi:MAG TPA: hypothetical protein VMZ71_11495 [Gemmataceae bacterium]|nr:hypothetical protein [Gemmataceae bacterium]